MTRLDHKQLQPTVISPDAVNSNLGQSLFARFAQENPKMLFFLRYVSHRL